MRRRLLVAVKRFNIVINDLGAKKSDSSNSKSVCVDKETMFTIFSSFFFIAGTWTPFNPETVRLMIGNFYLISFYAKLGKCS